ncbi:MAG: hypothetical protein R6U44_01005 [Archaeoglobaceae archaeon]
MKKIILCITTLLLLAISAQPCLGAEWGEGQEDLEEGPVDPPEWPGFEKEPVPEQPDWKEYKHEGGPDETLNHYRIEDGKMVKVIGSIELPEWEYENVTPEMAEWDYEETDAPISNRPEPKITSITYNSEMVTGQTGYLAIGVANLGTYSPQAEVVLSHSEGIHVINTSGNPSIYTPGEEVVDSEKNPMKVENTMLKWTSEFDVREEKVFSLNYKIDGVKEQWFKVRLYFIGQGSSWAARQIYPTEFESNITDQQGFPAIEFSVSVSEPQTPNAALSCLSQKSGDKINVNLTFKNLGGETLRNPAFTFAGKTTSGGWDLAPDSSKVFNFTLNDSEEDIITKEAKVSGCFQPCSRNYFSKTYKVSLYEEREEGTVYCDVEKIEEPSKEESRIEDVDASFKEMESAKVIREDKGVVQIVFEQINNLFKTLLVR